MVVVTHKIRMYLFVLQVRGSGLSPFVAFPS